MSSTTNFRETEPNPKEIKSSNTLDALKEALTKIEKELEDVTTDGDDTGAPLLDPEAHLKKCCESEEFATIFKQFPPEEQYDWIAKKYEHINKFMPRNLMEIMLGLFRKNNYEQSPTTKPNWVDMDKIRRGQQFIKDNVATCWLGMIYGIHLLFTLDDGLKPFVMTGKSTTPYESFKRYLDSMLRMNSIFFGEPWIKGTPAHKEILMIRAFHNSVRKNLEAHDSETLAEGSTLKNPYAPSHDIFHEKVSSVCPIPSRGQCPYTFWSYTSPKRPRAMNQSDMAVTQFGFIVFVVLKPKEIGIANATEEDLDAFCHLWRYIGYLLGMDDQFNFCRGSFEEVKQRTDDVMTYWIKPNMRNYRKDTEHLIRSLITGISFYFPTIPYEVFYLHTLALIDYEIDNLYTLLSYPQRLLYNIYTYGLYYLCKLSFMRNGLNKLYTHLVRRANNFDAKKHEELREKSLKSLLHTTARQPLPVYS